MTMQMVENLRRRVAGLDKGMTTELYGYMSPKSYGLTARRLLVIGSGSGALTQKATISSE
jgi:hypothetical protein